MHMNNIIAFPTKAELNNLKMRPKPYNQCEEIPQKELDLSFMYLIQRDRKAKEHIAKVRAERIEAKRAKKKRMEFIKAILISLPFISLYVYVVIENIIRLIDYIKIY